MAHPPPTVHRLVVVEAAAAVVAVVLPRATEHHLVAMEHHPAPMALHPEEDHLAPTEHLPTVVADHLRPMVHHQVAEDRLALMALPEAAAASAVDCRRAMAHHRVDHRYPLVTQHLFLEVVECPPAMARLLEAAVAADIRDHLPLTVHLAPVVAVSEGKIFFLRYFFHTQVALSELGLNRFERAQHVLHTLIPLRFSSFSNIQISFLFQAKWIRNIL